MDELHSIIEASRRQPTRAGVCLGDPGARRRLQLPRRGGAGPGAARRRHHRPDQRRLPGGRPAGTRRRGAGRRPRAHRALRLQRPRGRVAGSRPGLQRGGRRAAGSGCRPPTRFPPAATCRCWSRPAVAAGAAPWRPSTVPPRRARSAHAWRWSSNRRPPAPPPGACPLGARLPGVRLPGACPPGARPRPRSRGHTHFGNPRPALREALIRDLSALLDGGRSHSATYQVEGAPVQVLLELVEPPLALTVCGAGPDAEPLVTLAANLGWAPVVFDPPRRVRQTGAVSRRLPRGHRRARGIRRRGAAAGRRGRGADDPQLPHRLGLPGAARPPQPALHRRPGTAPAAGTAAG